MLQKLPFQANYLASHRLVILTMTVPPQPHLVEWNYCTDEVSIYHMALNIFKTSAV